MKTSKQTLLALATIVGLLTITTSTPATNDPKLAVFKIEITVDTENNGVRMKCAKGCAWKDLSFSCKDGVECTSTINAYGTPAI